MEIRVLHLAASLLSIFEVDILVSFHFANEFTIVQVKSVKSRRGEGEGEIHGLINRICSEA